MPLNRIYTDAIYDLNVRGSKIATNAIRGNNIVAGQITGNLIGTGAISANHSAGGGVTSDVLAANLSLSIARVTERIEINSTVVGSNSQSGTNVYIDVANSSVYYFTSNTTGNVTLAFRGSGASPNPTRFDAAVNVGNTVSAVVMLRSNTVAGRAGVNVSIDGGYISTTRSDLTTGNVVFYAGNTVPVFDPLVGTVPTTALETNILGINIIKRAANSYFVFVSNTVFGLG
jgi:hypothetical protein